ncbi:MAG: hypothetical protein IPK64_15940 [bacterium]|nr:hypothetical protein [bacterium]
MPSLHRPGRLLLAALVLAALVPAAGTARAADQAFFSEDAEGWFVRDISCSNYNAIVAAHALTWHGTGGDPGGYVSHHDVTNQCAFFVAPASWLGDRSAFAGGSLTFSLTSTERDYSGSDVVILIGAGRVICHELPQLPPAPPAWRAYVVPLEAGAFRYNNSAGAVVSAADFDAVLADVDVLMLPAEFGAEIEETVGLDSVRLVLPASATPVPAVATAGLAAVPNPFNPSTTLVFELPRAMPVRLTVHDMSGRLVRVLRDGQEGAGGHNEVAWDGRDDTGRAQPSGVYLARMDAAALGATTRLTLLR